MKWRSSPPMAAEPRGLSALYNLWVVRNAGVTRFAFDNPFDAASGRQMGNNCGSTGSSKQGPGTVVFRDNWAQTRGGTCSAWNGWQWRRERRCNSRVGGRPRVNRVAYIYRLCVYSPETVGARNVPYTGT